MTTKKLGRPCKDEEDKQSKLIGIRVTPGEFEVLKRGYLNTDAGSLSASLRDFLLDNLREKHG